MAGGYRKLRLILWKNWKIAARSPVLTMVEILIPVAFSSLILLLRVVSDVHNEEHVTHYIPFGPRERPSNGSKELRGDESPALAWAPEVGSTVVFVQACAMLMQTVFENHGARVIRKKDPETLESYLETPGVTDMLKGDKVACGIVFDGGGQDHGLCSKNLKVQIRFPGDLRRIYEFKPTSNWQTRHLIPTNIMLAPRDPHLNEGPIPSYYREGFLTVQAGISKGVIVYCGMIKEPKLPPDFHSNASIKDMFDAGALDPTLRMKRYSFPPYTADPLLDRARFIVPFLVMLSFIYTCLAITKQVTHEKETQMKEMMKIMGLQCSLHWIGWFIRSMAFLLTSCVLIVIILKVAWVKQNAFFQKTDGTVLYFFFIYYMVALTTFCFMMSSFFTNGHVASVAAGMVWFLFYCPHFFMISSNNTFTLSIKIPLCLFLNVAMAFSIEIFLYSESSGEGLTWQNICRPSSYAERITLCHTLMMMLLDAVLYMLICLYVEAVCPGRYGVPQRWDFFCTKEHWNSRRQIFRNLKPPRLSEKKSDVDKDNFEKVPTMKAGIHIKRLWKIFGQKVSVRNLSLKMYEGEITVFLGHNGAGKTTTMSIITGIYTPTYGTATVNGCDIVKNMEGARQSLGLCPQHNVLFDELTVREHLYFFCKLKGLPEEKLESEIAHYVAMLDLGPKKNARSKTLSGGMKRKLNAGIALCANSKVVLLDEPTSGMDPAARRSIWNMLIMEKADRTMLLTTHFMDEADVLGDRIAIMADGQLVCYGSPFFLKNRFGSGYRLLIEKGPKCDSDDVTALINRFLPGVQPAHDIGTELNYELQRTDVDQFAPMLQALEDERVALNLEGYGLSVTTLEDVFIRTGKDKESQGSIRRKSSSAPEAFERSHLPTLVTGCKLQRYRLRGLFLKRYIVFKREWVVFFLHCLIPILFVCVTLLVKFADDVDLKQTKLHISMRNYRYKDAMVVASKSAEQDSPAENPAARLMYTLYKRAVVADGGFIDDQGYHTSPVVYFDETILNKTTERNIQTRLKYIAGSTWYAENRRAHVIVWIDDLPYHSAPLSLSLVSKSALRLFDATLEIYNYPLRVSSETQALVGAAFSPASRIAPMLAFAMSFVAAYYVLFIVRERVCKNKHLQFVSGVDPAMFWAVHLTWDGISFLVPSLCAVLALAMFRDLGFHTAQELSRVFLVLIFFGWAMLPTMYAASLIFKIPATGYTRMAMFNIFAGTAAFIVIAAFKQMGMEETVSNLEYVFICIPHYTLAHALYRMYINTVFIDICHRLQEICDATPTNVCCPGKCPKTGCLKYSYNYFILDTPGIGLDLIIFFVVGCVGILILLLADYKVFTMIKDTIQRKKLERKHRKLETTYRDTDPLNEDDDVAAEKKMIRSADIGTLKKNYTLLLRDVTKYYGKFLAVNHTCLALKKGQCFGLLGTNGAGKTTTFKMMTGDIRKSDGDVYVDGFNLDVEKKEVRQRMGYCPQFDALLPELNGWETLKIFCLFRGIPKENIKAVCEELADELLMTKHMSKKVKTYSGGNKRKLSTAVALIGYPSVVFLDEPTTGMDPMARRHLWNVICNVRDSGTSVVLTSHSMEECEALCTRIAIQVNGNFKCLGSLQHLKNKFAKGFILHIKVSAPKTKAPISKRRSEMLTNKNSAPVKQFVSHTFPTAILKDEYMGVLTYIITDASQTWSQMFGLMEEAKQTYAIEDYSIGQTSLEMVFLSFTKQQV